MRRPRGRGMSGLWLWGTVPLALVGLVLVVVLATRLIQSQAGAPLAGVPLAETQELSLEAEGPMLLNGEGPRFSSAFGALDYRLTDLADGAEVPLEGILFKSSSSGFSTVRLSLRAFTLRHPGRYRLTVSGIADPAVAERHRVVFTRDNRGRLAAAIVGLVFSGIAAVVGLVLSLIVFLINRAGAPG